MDKYKKLVVLLPSLPSAVLSLNFVTFAFVGHGFLPDSTSDSQSIARSLVLLSGYVTTFTLIMADRWGI